MYKAKIDIGGYKAGEEVPADKAVVWMNMYKESPVEKIGVSAPVVAEDDLSPSRPTVESVNAMHDDYIDRNADVVKKAIAGDKLDKSTLSSLARLESSGKKRKPVLDAIKAKLKSL